MEPTEVIRGRRTVRDFRADDISQDKLDRVLEAVRWTPSWLNTQCWEVVVVRNHEQKKKLAGTVSEGNPAVPAMTKAPVVLVVCARRGISGFFDGKANTDKGDWFMFDTVWLSRTSVLKPTTRGWELSRWVLLTPSVRPRL